MTAIGFIIFTAFASWLTAHSRWFINYLNDAEDVDVLCLLAAIGGAAMVMLGIVGKLWSVMP